MGLARDFIFKRQFQSRMDIRHVFEMRLDRVGIQNRFGKYVAIRLKINGRAMLSARAQFFNGAVSLATPKLLPPFVPIAPDSGYHPLGKGIHHRRTDAVQTTRVDIVVAFAELSARVQGGEDQLQGRLAKLGMLVNRDAAPIVLDSYALPVLVQADCDGCGMTI